MLRGARALIVAQAALVWEMIDENTTKEHLEQFLETGQLEETPVVMPYNPAVMAKIAENWQWTK